MNKIEYFEAFMLKQYDIEQKLNKINRLFDKFEKYEKKSIKCFYENKDEFLELFDYLDLMNNYDYSEIQYFYDLVDEINLDNKKIIKNLLNWFIKTFQDMNFQLNIFINSYVENILNYEFSLEFLDEKDLNLDSRKITDKLAEIDVVDKLNYVEKQFFEKYSIKSIKSSLNNLVKWWFPIKISTFYLESTKWKFKKIKNYHDLIFFKQLYLRYRGYNFILWKNDVCDIFDFNLADANVAFLLEDDLLAMLHFLTNFSKQIDNYPILWLTKIVYKNILNSFWIYYKLDWKVWIKALDEWLSWKHLWGEKSDLIDFFYSESQYLLNIVYKGEYNEIFENYKVKFDLTDEEYELFKEMRFYSIFMTWNIVLEKMIKIKYSWVYEKLKNDKYFLILYKFWANISSFYWTYNDFQKADIKELSKLLNFIDKKTLNWWELNDINFIQKDVDYLVKKLKIT